MKFDNTIVIKPKNNKDQVKLANESEKSNNFIKLNNESEKSEKIGFKNHSDKITSEERNSHSDINELIEIDENLLKEFFISLISGLYQMHNLNLAHCDIKPQNIMLKQGQAKLADFGSVAQCDHED